MGPSGPVSVGAGRDCRLENQSEYGHSQAGYDRRDKPIEKACAHASLPFHFRPEAKHEVVLFITVSLKIR